MSLQKIRLLWKCGLWLHHSWLSISGILVVTVSRNGEFFERASNSDTVDECRIFEAVLFTEVSSLISSFGSVAGSGLISGLCSIAGFGFSSGFALISGLGLLGGFSVFALISGFALFSGTVLIGVTFSDVGTLFSAPSCRRSLRAASSPIIPACIGSTAVCVGLTAESAVD